jgi:hypothetical protein
MQLTIEKLITEFERGTLSRRQLALSIAALVTVERSSAAVEIRAVTLNHVTLRVPDVRRTFIFG